MMDKICEDKLRKRYFPFYKIGSGSCARCYLFDDNTVYKVFRKNGYAYELLHNKDINIEDRFEYLSKVNNDTFYGPKTIVVDNSENVVGYLMDYASGKTLNKLKGNCNISELLTAYRYLVEEIKRLSEHFVELKDVHERNILYDGRFKVVDLDKGILSNESYDEVLRRNIGKTTNCIINSIFNIERHSDVRFYNQDLNTLYNASINGDYKLVSDFFDYLDECLSLHRPEIKKYRSKKLSLAKINDVSEYYH